MIEVGDLLDGANRVLSPHSGTEREPRVPEALRSAYVIVLTSLVGVAVWVGIGVAAWHIFW